MSAKISCPHCSGRIKVNPSLSGKKVRCPHCKGVLVMPASDATPPSPARCAAPKKADAPVEQFDFESSSSPQRSEADQPKKELPKWAKITLICFASLMVLRGCIGIIGGGAEDGENEVAERDTSSTDNHVPDLPSKKPAKQVSMADGNVQVTDLKNQLRLQKWISPDEGMDAEGTPWASYAVPGSLLHVGKRQYLKSVPPVYVVLISLHGKVIFVKVTAEDLDLNNSNHIQALSVANDTVCDDILPGSNVREFFTNRVAQIISGGDERQFGHAKVFAIGSNTKLSIVITPTE